MKTPVTRFAMLVTLAAALAGCGGNDAEIPSVPAPAIPSTPATPSPSPPSAVTAVVGPAGGTVTGPDGVQVIVPAGALEQPTTIGIARSSVGAPTPLPSENPPAGAAYEFTPHDLVFRAPVTIRMPVPANAVGSEVFMASPGEGWQTSPANVTAGVAEWQRNSFSWGLMGALCAIPANNTDPYPCTYAQGGANASAVPASAIARSAWSTASGTAGSWTVNQAGTVSLTLSYRAAPDCGVNGNPLTGQVKLIRWNPAVSPRATETLFDAQVALTATQVNVPAGTFATASGGPALRAVGSTTVDVSAFLTDATNAFYFSFSCNRPNHPVQRGGDLLTFIGPMPIGPRIIGGTVSGLTAAGLVLQNNGGDNLSVAANASSFAFATPVANGSAYSVSVQTQPSGQVCSVQNGSGTASGNVSNVAVVCGSAGPRPLAATGMATGYASSLVVATDGTVWAWGYQVDPVTGGYKSAAPWATLPVQVQGLSGVKAVALSAEAGSSYALHTDGTVSAWGTNDAGQLGDRTATTRPSPVKVLQDATTPMDEVCSIAASDKVLLMARVTGCSPGNRAVVAGPWIAGLFTNSTFGGDSSTPSPVNGAVAKPVPGLPAGVAVKQLSGVDASGGKGAVFITLVNGSRYAWGDNTANRLGAGATTSFAGGVGGPADVSFFWSGTCCTELGRTFAVALDETLGLRSVGTNANGELGNGGAGPSSALTRVSLLTNVSAFSVGQVSAAAITGGQLWAWGWNGNIAVTVPTLVGTATGFTAVSVGDIHSLAIGPGGEVYSWGDSSFGALGRTGSAAVPGVVMRP